MASEGTWAALKAAMQDVADALHTAAVALLEAPSAEAHRTAAGAVRRAVPDAWAEWMVMLFTKPKKPLDELDKRRDIYLQPHGLKLFMNALKPEYDAVMREAHQRAAAGFRAARNAPECSVAMALQREQAVAERRPWYRGYLDYSGMFQSCVRRVQRMMERRVGVRPSASDSVLALHAVLEVRYDAGEALTEGVESEVGNGQGDSAGPVRSMVPLALVAKAVDALVAGYPYRTAPGARERRVPQVWFCDDGSFGTDDFEMLQTCFLVVSAVSRTLGLQIGVDAAGGKTAWSGAEWKGGAVRGVRRGAAGGADGRTAGAAGEPLPARGHRDGGGGEPGDGEEKGGGQVRGAGGDDGAAGGALGGAVRGGHGHMHHGGGGVLRGDDAHGQGVVRNHRRGAA